MITQAQIAAETITPALTDDQLLALTMLVKQYQTYQRNSVLWPRLDLKLEAEVATPTVKTQALKAILTRLNALPAIKVESEGTADSRSFFSVQQNWDMLAQDVLDILYEVPQALTYQIVSIVQRKIESATIEDNPLAAMDPSYVGTKRY